MYILMMENLMMMEIKMKEEKKMKMRSHVRTKFEKLWRMKHMKPI